VSSENAKLFVCVRKRPVDKRDILQGELDCVTAFNPQIIVHECKYKIDGFTKYIEDQNFIFDNVFNENNTTADIFKFTIAPAVDLVLNKGIITCFAYGQTGSGKTFTMKGIEDTAIDTIFNTIQSQDKKLVVYLSFFEIYGGRLFDLLNNKNKLSVLEDSNQKIQIFGLEEMVVETAEKMREFINQANNIRTTHNTVTNATSSRSHAICNVILANLNKFYII
jgi:kinesin family protein 2/24